MENVKTIRQRPMPASKQALLNVYWFSVNVMWASILLIIMPTQIQSVVGDSKKGVVLGLVLSIGAIVSMLVGPIIGALSDRIRLPGGHRKPWIVIGTLGIVPSLWALSHWTRAGDSGSLPGWLGAFIVLQLFSSIASAPACALIPDRVPFGQRGSAAGWLGLMSMLGIFVGGATGFLIIPLGISAIYNILIVVMLAGMLITVWGVDEPTIGPRIARPFTLRDFLTGLYTPFKRPDFSWVFLNRLLIGMGTFTIQEFILYYMADGFGAAYTLPFIGKVANTPEDAVSIFLPTLILGAIATSLVAGVLSDKHGRKPITYAAGLMLGVMCMIFTFSHSFPLALLVGALFGLGYGAYESLSWALASDALPSMNDHGKDMGLWHVAVVLPQVIATPIAGFLLDHFQMTGAASNIPHMGYIIIFSIAVVYFILGSIFLQQIKGLS